MPCYIPTNVFIIHWMFEKFRTKCASSDRNRTRFYAETVLLTDRAVVFAHIAFESSIRKWPNFQKKSFCYQHNDWDSFCDFIPDAAFLAFLLRIVLQRFLLGLNLAEILLYLLGNTAVTSIFSLAHTSLFGSTFSERTSVIIPITTVISVCLEKL